MADEKISRKIDKELKDISTDMDSVYSSIYLTRSDDKNNLNQVVNDINGNINDILSQINGKNVSDISDLYVRLINKDASRSTTIASEIGETIESFFDNRGLIMDSLNLQNIRKSIQAENYQYDLICKYMTKLEDALEIKKDNVLSSDNFTKDFVNIVSNKSDEESIGIFNDNALILKEKYDIQNLFEDIYYKTSKYGEYFLYEVPYTKAFERLLNRKEKLMNGIKYESATILEAGDLSSKNSINSELSQDFIKEINEDMKVNIIFDESGICPKPIELVKESLEIRGKYTSLTESFMNSDNNGSALTEGELKWEDDNGLSQDGVIGTEKDTTKLSKDIKGAVLAELKREDVIPIYMDTTPIGYLYITVSNNWVEELIMNGSTYNSLTNNTKIITDDFDRQNDILVSQISGMMAEKINKKFINANIDLKEEIYAVLRHNDRFCATHGTNNVTVTFLPVEDVHHFYFKLNPNTHRGISDLEKAMVPAMIYCMLYLNSAIANVGRAQDKRIYYVKQNVEQNVSRTLLNVVNQLKKGNMGIRQLENMNSIFNVIGKFNDHIIPVSQSGDHPIDFEVMQGQNVDTPTELMDKMEDMAVSSTDVPLEFVNTVNNVDYATRFTMSNSKFLRKVFARQRICQGWFTKVFRNLYYFEYGDNDMSMKLMLPAPAYLSMNNSNQLINNVRDYVNSISDFYCTGESDEVKANFLKLVMRNQLGTYIDFSMIDDLLEQAKIVTSIDKDDADLGGGEESY